MLTTETKYYEDESMFHGFIPHVMGTRFDLLLIGLESVAADVLWREIVTELERLDKMLNRFDPESEIARINAVAPRSSVEISSDMTSILRLCRDYYQMTEYLFDVTLTNFTGVRISTPNKLFFSDSTLSLDLGGFAKGYALKQIAAMLRYAKTRSAFVDFGGSSILGIGRHPYGSSWKVSLPDPYSQQILAEFTLENQALSTSGNTKRYTAHIVNPQTGIYDTDRKLAAVVSDDPLDAEVLSTVRMIADETLWNRIVRNFKQIQATLYTQL